MTQLNEVAFAPAGVNQEQNYQYKDSHTGIENQIRKIGGGKSNKIHDDILSIRSDAHQLAAVIANPDINTPEPSLSTANKNGIIS